MILLAIALESPVVIEDLSRDLRTRSWYHRHIWKTTYTYYKHAHTHVIFTDERDDLEDGRKSLDIFEAV